MISRSMRKLPIGSTGLRVTKHNYSSFFKSLSTPASFSFTEGGNVMSNLYLTTNPEPLASPFVEFANNFGFSTITNALMNMSQVV